MCECECYAAFFIYPTSRIGRLVSALKKAKLDDKLLV